MKQLYLGFQHYIVMQGTTVMLATVLVPQTGGNHVNPFPHLLISILMLFYFICLFKLKSNPFICPFFSSNSLKTGRQGTCNSNDVVYEWSEHFTANIHWNQTPNSYESIFCIYHPCDVYNPRLRLATF